MRKTKCLGVVIVCILQIGMCLSTKNLLRASSITQKTIGSSVNGTALLGDTHCVASQIGPIRCSSIGHDDTVISDLGPLARKTILDFSRDSRTMCSISSEYIAYCWGYNENAAVGDNTTVYRSAPTPVYTAGALSGIKLNRIAVNSNGACAVSTVGRLYCWGSSGLKGSGIYDRFHTGQDGTVDLIPPTAVSDVGLTSLTWVDVEAINSNTTCAMSTTGVFKCFGASITTYVTSSIPANETITSMSAGYWDGSIYACALTNLGKVFCIGGYYFQNATSSPNGTFGQVNLGTTATSVRLSDTMACAVLSNGGVSCWGYGLERKTGLGLTGYPVVLVMPAGSQSSEAVPGDPWGPGVLIRKTTGELVLYPFNINSTDDPIPTPIDVSLRTPSISITDLSLSDSFVGCSATITQICASLEMTVDSLTSSTISYNIYSDQTALSLEETKTADLKDGNLNLGTVDGLKDHWIKITANGPFGTTTSSVIQIPKQYFPPSSPRVTASFDNFSTCFELNVSNSVGDEGGMEGLWSYLITNLKSGATKRWNGSNGCQSFFKTSSLYAVKAIFTTPAGSIDATTKLSTGNFRLRHKLFRSTMNSIKSTFLVQSSGKQSWSASSGCAIRGGYLVIGYVNSCSVRLKITAAKGFVGSSETYSINVFK